MKKKDNKNNKVLIFYAILIVAVIIASATIFSNMKNNTQKIQYSQIADLFENKEVKSFTVDENGLLTIKKQDGKEVSFRLLSLSIFYEDFHDIYTQQHKDGIIESYQFEEPTLVPWWVSYIPYLIGLILFVVLWFFVIRQSNGMGKINSFGKIRGAVYNNKKQKVLFKDVAGADEEKAELQEVVEFLKNPSHYSRLGAKIPHGVLLVGPPGTGKTLLAKAVAGEADVPFLAISGSDFVEMYVGVGASRVRDLFETAKKSPASIIFIDEIDAVGRHRGAGLGGGHDEREQTLNQLLVEMDGFGSNEGVIVIAATNRPDILDPALLRPGRFDRRITVNYPDVKGREEILKVHAVGKPFEEDVDLAVIAKTTTGFTGADLANLLNEAALLAAQRGKSLIGMNDIEDATIKVIVGPQKKSRVVSEKEKKLTAFHEGGHAIVTHYIQPETPVHQISIIPAGRTGGFTLSLPTDENWLDSKDVMKREIATLLGGRVAEALVLGDISTGASNDIARATQMARNMVTKFGMSDILGPIVYGSEHSDDEVFLGRDFSAGKNYSESTSALIDEEIKKIVTDAYALAEKTLNEHMDKLKFVAEFLIKNETMEENQFKAAMENDEITIEELEEMKSEQRKRSERENQAQADRIKAEREAREKEILEAEKAKEENKDDSDEDED